MDDDYLKHIMEADERAVDNFDKATLTLSGGGLGISLAFLDRIAAQTPVATWALILSWVSWALSVTLVIASFHAGHGAMRRLMKQTPEERAKEKPGGWWSKVTDSLNIIAFVLFVKGAFFMATFAILNL